jgi:hypothetical protein
MKVAIVAELILLLTAGFGWAHTDLSAGAKAFPAASPDSSLYTKLPPVRADKKAKPLPQLSSKQPCPGKSDASEYCYEVCDSEGKKCRWLTPSQYIAHLENRKPLSESTVSKPQPLASHWSDREIAERMARNASGVCYSKPCQRVCENEPTPGWVITHHLESVWRENNR